MEEWKRSALDGLLRESLKFARAFPPPPSRWQRFKWWLRIEKRPPPVALPRIEAGATIRIRKPPRYSPIGSEEQLAEQKEKNERFRKALDT